MRKTREGIKPSAQALTALARKDEPVKLVHVFEVDHPLKPGHSLSLKCSATGLPLPQITWIRDDEFLYESGDLRIGDFVTNDGVVNSFVNISAVKVLDSGNYQCTASNDVSKVSYSKRINVFGNPYVRPMKNISVVAGKALRLNCPAVGHPIEWIKWYKGGTPLPHNHRQIVFPNGTLVLKNVERSVDEDRYRCSAGNKLGSIASSDVYIRVLMAPVIAPFSPPAKLREGMRSMLGCLIVEGDPPIQIDFLKDGRLLVSDGNIKIERSNDFSSTLYITNVTSSHSGNYTCKASNQVASASYSVNMSVNGEH